ncbi:hypothetical protein IV203_022157 [Nitzschia inconspicua]|uniref:Uncharacterized protein n=1 Tax=Nitzschia inconspicua TaxID=303405 RepID=A0A9K3KI59_9STRA|nr:hypothetical protein IV203_022157 [Nitzschia inconspicua]
MNSVSLSSRRLVSRLAVHRQQHLATVVSIRRSMGTITQGVEFDTIAREWRCKWSKENDMESLQRAQKALEDILADLKDTAGCKAVHRVVCGGHLDFKVITSVSADQFPAWKDAEFAPEASFLTKLSTIDGITQIETQTYTFMEV